MEQAVPKISDAEWLVMKELWREHPQSTSKVIEALAAKASWEPTTIKTLLSRLVAKGALAYTKEGREHLYTPLIAEEAWVIEESRSFLRKVFGGALSPMVAALMGQAALSPEDLAEMRRLLEPPEDKHDAE